jgi:hypothetical protein
MDMETEYDAFISYSSLDGYWVHNCLLYDLEGAGLNICIDTKHFDIGVPSLINIERAIERSRRIILVLSPRWIRI